LLLRNVNAPFGDAGNHHRHHQLLLFVSMLHLLGWPHRGFTTIVIAISHSAAAYVTVHGANRALGARIVLWKKPP